MMGQLASRHADIGVKRDENVTRAKVFRFVYPDRSRVAFSLSPPR